MTSKDPKGDMMSNHVLSRRGFAVAGAATIAGTASIVSPFAMAQADEMSVSEDAGSVYDETHEVVIVGAGLAGLSAGLKLLDLGVDDVLVITKASDAGYETNSIVAGGTFNFPNDDTDESRAALIDVYNIKSNGKGRQDLTELIVNNIREDLDWLVGHGCEFTEPTQSVPYDALQFNAAPGSGMGMPALMEQMVSEYTAAGGAVLTEAKLIDLLLDDKGAVAGVKVRTAAGYVEIGAQATVVATGGYVANKQLLEQYVGPDGDQIMVRGQASLTGDGVLAVERIGGMIYQAGGMDQTVHLAAVAPVNPAMCNPYQAIQQTIAINAEGKRYVDESKGYVTNGKAVFNQTNQTCALIFDDTIAQIDSVKADMDKFATYGAEVLEADTIEDLAALIEVDPSVLRETVEEYNSATDGEKTTGLEVEKTSCANKIETAPFHAFYPLSVGSIMCFGGIYTDGDCRVLEADGTPISGLYAAGEIIGGVFQYDYLAGSSLNRSLVTGVHVAGLIAEGLK